MAATDFPKTDPRVERSRNRVLDAATEILVEQGPRACTVDAIAEQSGVAKSTIYRHWSTRAELVVEVIHRAMPTIESSTDETFEAALRTLLRQAARGFKSPLWSRIFPAIATLRYTLPDVAELAEKDRERKLDILAEVLALGRAEGRFGTELRPSVAMHLLIGPIVMATMGGYEDTIDELVERSADQFLAAHPIPVR